MVLEYDRTIEALGERLRALDAQKLEVDAQIDRALKRVISSAGDGNGPNERDGVPSSQPPTGALESLSRHDERIIAIEALGFLAISAALYLLGIARGRRRSAISRSTPEVGELRVALDAIALEVERISENQRFVTALLTKRGERATLRSTPPDAP